FQTVMSPSSPPAATSLPSGLAARLTTAPGSTRGDCVAAPECASTISIRVSEQPDDDGVHLLTATRPFGSGAEMGALAIEGSRSTGRRTTESALQMATAAPRPAASRLPSGRKARLLLAPGWPPITSRGPVGPGLAVVTSVMSLCGQMALVGTCGMHAPTASRLPVRPH